MSLVHYYDQIPGWFDFQDLYLEAVRRADNDDPRVNYPALVEVGSYLGRSLAFLGVEIVNSKKRIELYSVDDLFRIRAPKDDPDPQIRAAAPWHDLPAEVVLERNMRPCVRAGLDWHHFPMTSAKAAAAFPDRFFDFVFVDADHAYESVRDDLGAWWPKVRPGGWLAGHDHIAEFPGVIRAVREFFEIAPRFSRTSFAMEKPLEVS